MAGGAVDVHAWYLVGSEKKCDVAKVHSLKCWDKILNPESLLGAFSENVLIHAAGIRKFLV